MADQFYPKGKEKMLRAQIDWGTDPIMAAVVSSGYVFNAAHEFASALVILGTPVALANVSTTNGVVDCDDLVFDALATGNTAKAVVLYKQGADAASSPLLAYFDQIPGLPFSTSGAGLTLRISDGANKLFSL